MTKADSNKSADLSPTDKLFTFITDRRNHTFKNFEKRRISCAQWARTLIDLGADVNASNALGESPIYLAALNGYAEIVLVLIEANADVNAACTEYKLTPLHASIHSGAEDASDQYLKIVGYLIAAGANVNATALDGTTPLHMTCNFGGLESKKAKALVAAGADVNAKDVNGRTLKDLLHLDLTESSRSRIAALLSKRKPKRNSRAAIASVDGNIIHAKFGSN